MTQRFSRFLATGECGFARRTLGWHPERSSARVLGEDAIELSAGATNCTTDCQARNRIQDSVPVPPDPTAPTPLG